MRFWAFIIGLIVGWSICIYTYLPRELPGKWYYFEWGVESGIVDRKILIDLPKDLVEALNDNVLSEADVEAYKALINENVLESLRKLRAETLLKLRENLRFNLSRIIILNY